MPRYFLLVLFLFLALSGCKKAPAPSPDTDRTPTEVPADTATRTFVPDKASVADAAPQPTVADAEPTVKTRDSRVSNDVAPQPVADAAPTPAAPIPDVAPQPAVADAPHPPSNGAVRIRIMTSNTTSGEDQSYDNGEGIRFFRAMKPDVVLIQEFNYFKNTIPSFVKSTFGKEYVFHRGKGDIPNGIISRYPITGSGAWKSNRVSDRQWDWAVIDIPGDRDLLAISVHLFTKDNEAEMKPLLQQIEKKVKADGKNYYVILGGDFNQTDWNILRKNLSTVFDVGFQYKDWPQDQNRLTRTNATRHKQIDYLLCNPDLCALETPVVIGKHSYPRGHVLDSRVYADLGELGDIPPVKATDSAAPNMQHMPVIRDFVIP